MKKYGEKYHLDSKLIYSIITNKINEIITKNKLKNSKNTKLHVL